MNTISITGLLFVIGTVVTASGFGTSPSGIYTEKSQQVRLGMLEAHPRRWTVLQWIVALGGLITVAGSILLFLSFREGQGALLFGVGMVGFVLGHIPWIWQLMLRIAHPSMFAEDKLPGWLFETYSILTLLGLASYGSAFWLQGDYRVLGIGLLLASLLVLGLFIKLRGMPPIVYYAMTLAMGITLLL